jgi:hypothetical protein
MEEKISQQAIVRYSKYYSEKILALFFTGKSHIGGQELLNLTAVEQINLFVIQTLFHTWRTEMKNSRSVYFNYEADAVKHAQQELMNVLSRYISIDRPHLQPLLEQATVQTLNNVLNPYDFFSKLIVGNNHQLSAESFRDELKYLKLNKAPLLRLSQILQERKIEVISGNEAFSILDKILEDLNFTPEDIEPLLQKLSLVAPVKLEDFYENQSSYNTNSIFETEPTAIRPSSKNSINDFQKVNAIKDSLTINQKFMFTKALFEGDFEKFTEAVSELDTRKNFDDALLYLGSRLNKWDQESEAFHEFMELVEKRFS